MNGPKRVYVQQYGAFWSMSPYAWKRAVKRRASGGYIDFDDPRTFGLEPVSCKRIGKPNTVLKGESGFWSASAAHPLMNTVDWTDDDWCNAAKESEAW